MRQVMTRWLVVAVGFLLIGACALFAVVQN
jgi:uncharacterized membrane protein YqhA